MRAREVIKEIEQAKCGKDKACAKLRQRGSHIFFECRCSGEVCTRSKGTSNDASERDG
ncbi:MAG: hypothetical protein ACRDY7_11070 [Acidimicrobiia bacterium]